MKRMEDPSQVLKLDPRFTEKGLGTCVAIHKSCELNLPSWTGVSFGRLCREGESPSVPAAANDRRPRVFTMFV